VRSPRIALDEWTRNVLRSFHQTKGLRVPATDRQLVKCWMEWDWRGLEGKEDFTHARVWLLSLQNDPACIMLAGEVLGKRRSSSG
jgi:hypothetical protein